MFKKKPQIKNLSPLRSSDRRRLADQIIADYGIPIPPPQPELAASEHPASAPPIDASTTTTPSPTLSSLRSSLLPDSSLSARFTTTSGPTSTLVSGTLYVGTHPGQDERVLWIQFSNDKQLYPTVYTLWHNPGIVPLLHTQGVVVDKLKGGADLMIPGLIGGPPWPEKAKKGSVVCVAGIGDEKESVPVWVGICETDVCDLGDVRGGKGRAVRGLHWAGDEIWIWNSVAGKGGSEPPNSIEGWNAVINASHPRNGEVASVEQGVEELDLGDDDIDDAQEDGGVALESSQHLEDGQTNGGDSHQAPHDEGREDSEPTTSDVDAAFYQAFLYALYDAKKQNSPPHYGFELPIQPSYLVSNMIQPHLRFSNQHYTIKKTSWKNTKKFIKQLDKQQIIKSKDRNGGETVILDIDFEDPHIKDFVPYRLPKPKSTEANGENNSSHPASSSGDASLNQILNLITLIRPSPRLVPDLLPNKHHFYTPQQVSAYLKTYISNSPETTTATSSPRNVKINPFIANNILGSNTTATDTRALAAREIARDTLLRRIVDDHSLCPQYWVLLKPSQSWDPEDSSLPKPKPAPLPKINITIEKRTGSKLVTKISNLETFGINPSILAPELQRKCAGSASVGQLVGGKPGMMEILVQGDQRDVVTVEMGRRGVQKVWIDVTDKSKKGGKGAGGGAGAGGRR